MLQLMLDTLECAECGESPLLDCYSLPCQHHYCMRCVKSTSHCFVCKTPYWERDARHNSQLYNISRRLQDLVSLTSSPMKRIAFTGVRVDLASLDGACVVDCVAECTHLVCACDPSTGRPKRTIKYLEALLCRDVWIVSLDWVLDSLRLGEWVSELEYELDALSDRLTRPLLFSGLCCRVLGECGGRYPSREALERLLEMGGARLYPRGHGGPHVLDLVAGEGGGVSVVWMLDSIAEGHAVPMEPYLV
jgi:hypothetical protein